MTEKGFQIQSVTIDGRRGIARLFESYSILVQICQFHIQSMILRKTTLNPKTDCGKKLKYIATHFIQEHWSKDKFIQKLRLTLEKFKDFLNEKNDKNQYLHRRLRSAIFGIKQALPYLFTYQDYPQLNIPNTTNHIDGGVNTKVKNLVKLHIGMRVDRRNKLLINLLYNLKGKS